MECIQLTPTEQNRLDAFQMKGIRRLMNIPPTHVDRTWTNDMVYTRASEECGKPIMRFSDMYNRQKLRLLGHILRADETDPMRQVTFEGNTWKPRNVTARRRGRPRDQWLVEAMRTAFDELVQNDHVHFDWEDSNHVQMVVAAAQKPAHEIFDSKPPSDKQLIFSALNSDLDHSD